MLSNSGGNDKVEGGDYANDQDQPAAPAVPDDTDPGTKPVAPLLPDSTPPSREGSESAVPNFLLFLGGNEADLDNPFAPPTLPVLPIPINEVVNVTLIVTLGLCNLTGPRRRPDRRGGLSKRVSRSPVSAWKQGS